MVKNIRLTKAQMVQLPKFSLVVAAAPVVAVLDGPDAVALADLLSDDVVLGFAEEDGVVLFV